MIPNPHIPIEKKSEAQRLVELYQAWRDAGGVPTVIKRETLRQMGMAKRGRWGAHINENVSLSRFVVGEKRAPMRIERGA